MTIDITIGKIKYRTLKDVLDEKIDNDYSITYNNTFQVIDFIEVIDCPPEDDGCTKDDTMCPGEAYRSGSTQAMSDFFRTILGSLASSLRPISSNDRQVTRIKPFLKQINELVFKGEEPMHAKRLHWLQFWCNKAVELYGDKAVIQFT